MLRRLPITLIAAVLVVACASAAPASTAPPGGTPTAGVPSAIPSVGNPASLPGASPAASGLAYTVSSPDGLATLGVPDGALPSGLDVSSLKVTTLQTASGAPGTSLLAVVKLEPEGTQFLKPLTLSLTFSQPPPTLPALLLASGTNVELLDTTDEIDVDSGSITATAPIQHFSNAIAYAGNIKAELSYPGDQALGKSFGVTATVSRAQEHLYNPMAGDDLAAKIVNAITFAQTSGALNVLPGNFEGYAGLTPTLVPAPESQTQVADQPLSMSGQFQCTEEGATRVRYKGAADQQIDVTSFVGFTANGGRKFTSFIVTGQQFYCLAAAATATPKPTPTPTPTPTPAPSAQVLQMLPDGVISGACFRYLKSPPPAIDFTAYIYNLPMKNMILTIDGVNNGEPTSMPFDPAGPGFEHVTLPATGSGPFTIKSVIVVQPDGTQLDITKPFTDFMEQNAGLADGSVLDFSKKSGLGTICP